MEVVLKNISRTYRTKNEISNALDSISLRFESSKFYVITGPSGSGKTTLLNIAGLIDNDYTGDVIFHKKEKEESFGSKTSISMLSSFRKNNIGYMTQNFGLINFLSCYDNIILPFVKEKKSKELKDKVYNIADKFGIAGLLNKFPDCISGGEKQRVALCRIMLKDADLILADEPTAMLDSDNTKLVLREFEKLVRDFKKTVVLITHDNKITADVKIMLREGQIESII